MPDFDPEVVLEDIKPVESATVVEYTEPTTAIEDHITSSISSLNSSSRIQGNICGVCHKSESKYKCSRCEVPYCSVACSTLHRATHPPIVDGVNHAAMDPDASELPDQEPKPPPSYPNVSRGSGDVFAPLKTSRDLQTLFLIYPRLRSQLRDIYSATLPPKDKLTQNHKDLGRSWGDGSSVTWNHDRGMQEGIDALAKAKMEYGKGGEGIREYSDLLLKLVSTEGIDVSQLVQDEVAEENAKLIASLLNGESY